MPFIGFMSIIPSPASFGGRFQDWLEQHSNSARRSRGHDRPGSQSYSRNQEGCLGTAAEGEPAFPDAEGQRDADTVDRQPELEEPERSQSLHRGSDRDRFRRRIRRYSLPGHQDRSGWSHKHDAHSTTPAAG